MPALLAAFALAAGLGCGSRHAPAASNAKPVQATPASVTVAPPPTADQVRAQLTEAVKTMPDDPNAQLELALFYRNTNDLPAAERELNACWQRFPRFPRAPYYLGLLYLTHSREADAVAPLQAAAALAPHDPQVQINAGLACFRTGQRDQALRYAQAAIRIDPQVAEAYMLLARLYDHHGTANLALANLQTYLRYSPNPAPGYYLLGRIYASQADRDKALLWTQRAVTADPKNAEFLLTLGRIYYELYNATHADDGIRCYQQALELDPNYSDAHLYLGRALVRQRKWEEAIPHFQAALRTASDTGPIYYDLGQALIKTGQIDEGQKALAAYNTYREYNDGVAKLRSDIAAAPQDRARRYAIARFCLHYHQYNEAMAELREAVRKLGPDDTLGQLMAEAERGLTAMQHEAAAPSAGSGTMPGLLPDPGTMPPLSLPSAGTAASSLPGGSENGR